MFLILLVQVVVMSTTQCRTILSCQIALNYLHHIKVFRAVSVLLFMIFLKKYFNESYVY